MKPFVAGLSRQPTANRQIALGIGVLVAVEILLAFLGLLVPIKIMLRGWLTAFAIWSLCPVGSMTLLLIHCLTGGEWGRAAAPVLRPAAAMVPLVALAFVPVLVGLGYIYPWAADSSAVPPDVARWYLSGPSFAVRAVITLAGWSVLGVVFAAGAGSRLLAGFGLAFFGLTISLVAVDWYLSLEPHYVASAFASMIAIQQLLAALAVSALIGLPQIEGKAAGDLGGLLIATLLGVVYLELMTFVVAWYGDLPDKAGLVSRTHGHRLDRRPSDSYRAGRRSAVRIASHKGDPGQSAGLTGGRRPDFVRLNPACHLAIGAGLRPSSRHRCCGVRRPCRARLRFPHDRTDAWFRVGGSPCRMKKWATGACRSRPALRTAS